MPLIAGVEVEEEGSEIKAADDVDNRGVSEIKIADESK